jgi:predicted ATPase
MMCAGHRALGTTLYNLGTLAEAHTHFTQGLALYDLQQHRASTFLYGEDSGVMCQSFAARALWHLGYPDQALAQSHEAVTLAQQIVHPFSLGFALVFATMVHQYRRDARAVHRCAEATLSLAMAQGFPLWRAQGAIYRGWTLAQQAGHAQAGIEQLHQGLSAFRATGAEINRSYFLGMLAEAHGNMGQPEAGLAALTEALALVDTTGERWYAPELHRLKGALLLQLSSDNKAEAEACFQQSIRIAQSQQARSLELRAATSLARLWQRQGKRQEAYDLLAPVYHWFTEGFDTLDLQEAKALLEELEEERV